MQVNRPGVFYPPEDRLLDHEAQTCKSHRGGSPSEGKDRGISPPTKRTSPRREGKSKRSELKLFEINAWKCSLFLMLVFCILLISYQCFVNVYVFNYMDQRSFSFELNSFKRMNISDILEGVVSYKYKNSIQGDLGNSTKPKFTSQLNQTKKQEKIKPSTKLNTPSTDISEPTVKPRLHKSSIKLSEASVVNQCLTQNQSLPSCPPIPAKLVGRLKIDLTTPSWSEVANVSHGVRPGGEFSPPSCVAKDKVAVVLPYRNRPDQLRIFLHHIHPILMRQDIHYQIFIVNQAGTNSFNRAMLFNVGFVEASKFCDWDCVVFHDVDLLPEDDRNLYTCPEQPRHLSVAVNKFKYKLPYNAIFGGASVLTKEHFKLVNGFSNQFWGWGGEDDNMSDRLRHHGLKITRYKDDIARYTMIPHQHEATNKPNPHRGNLLKAAKKYHDKDGLNNLKYKLISADLEDFYTNITVSIDKVRVANVMPKPS